ncbi:hypothetical protein COLO4_19680 [Corchorus olitorius]|uniref:Pentatricopeptide repeat-containing protein n=1 Tax=Corchorus olitorius TaxID=93759 RepID=A0A1R3J459_9ROSI|nr:hypothetical protein COLO4_19680 [Corchorus olitorius]
MVLQRVEILQKQGKFFDKVPLEFRNVVTWNVMVDGYNANGELEAARKLFEMMPERNFFVWSSMISGYCKRGEVKEARNIFDRIPVRNLVNWNSMISGYAQNGFCEEALEMFKKMQSEGFGPLQVDEGAWNCTKSYYIHMSSICLQSCRAC